MPLTNYWKNQSPFERKIFIGIALGLVILLGLYLKSGFGETQTSEELAGNRPTATVQRGALTIDIVESGQIRPRSQMTIRNDLEDAATILFIAPEGTLVEEGDLILELDVTELENDVIERRIRVQNSESELINATSELNVAKNQSQADLESAELELQFAKQDLKKYIDGEFPQQKTEMESRITLAEQELSQTLDDLEWSKRLFDQKYISQSEYQQDELAANRARLDVELAKADLGLLEEYTRPRTLAELESNVRQAELKLERTKDTTSANLARADARLSYRQAELQEESARLQELEKALTRAKVYAPIDGMILYASSVRNSYRRNDEPIEVGATIREREEIIYLPTASEYNVDIKVNEVDLGKVVAGLPVEISVDAIPDRVFTGRVKSIAQLPDNESRYLNPNLKLYKTEVELDSNQTGLRNGMSCQAKITVEKYVDVLSVPIQAVVRQDGKSVVYVMDDQGIATPRPVEIGMDNSKFIHIKSGLEEGQQILLAPPLKSATKDENEPENADSIEETSDEIKATGSPAIVTEPSEEV